MQRIQKKSKVFQYNKIKPVRRRGGGLGSVSPHFEIPWKKNRKKV
jgi:hypothetical protein